VRIELFPGDRYVVKFLVSFVSVREHDDTIDPPQQQKMMAHCHLPHYHSKISGQWIWKRVVEHQDSVFESLGVSSFFSSLHIPKAFPQPITELDLKEEERAYCHAIVLLQSTAIP
jgi:hypothetical protein